MRLPISNTVVVKNITSVSFDIDFFGGVTVMVHPGFPFPSTAIARFLPGDLVFCSYRPEPSLPTGGIYSLTHMNDNKIYRYEYWTKFSSFYSHISSGGNMTKTIIDEYPILTAKQSYTTNIYMMGGIILADASGCFMIVGARSLLGSLSPGSQLEIGGYDSNQITFRNFPIANVYQVTNTQKLWTNVLNENITGPGGSHGSNGIDITVVDNGFTPEAGNTFSTTMVSSYFNLSTFRFALGLSYYFPYLTSAWIDLGFEAWLVPPTTVTDQRYKLSPFVQFSNSQYTLGGTSMSMATDDPDQVYFTGIGNTTPVKAGFSWQDGNIFRFGIKVLAVTNPVIPIPPAQMIGNISIKSGQICHWANVVP